MQITHSLSALLVVFLAILVHCESRRSAYRLPKAQGRSAAGTPSPQDVGSGRDLMKKFMLMRGLFQQPPSDNVIVITQPSTTTTTTTPTGSPTTTTSTTTTTTPTTNSTGRSFRENIHQMEPQVINDDEDDEGEDLQDMPVTMTMTGRALEDRLDLPEVQGEEEEVQKPQKVAQWPKKFRLKAALSGKRNLVKKTHRRVHKHPQKKKRQQKRKVNKKQQKVNGQQRNSETAAVNFIEPYHHDGQPKAPAGQSASDSRLQRIWRRFQIAN